MKNLKKMLSLTCCASMIMGLGVIAHAEEEEKYDFGGVTIKCFGSVWDNLDKEDADEKWAEAKAYVEEKYNVVLEHATMDGYDGYNDDDLLIASVSAGDPVADIITLNPESLVACYMNGILFDETPYLDDLQVGSIYSDAGTWQGKCYAISYDNLGDAWVLAYDRKYLEEIGMEKTPTDMFMEGKWDYESFKEYCVEMKSNLPDGVYPIGQYPYHWMTMAAGANGKALVDSDGRLNMASDEVIEAMSFYQELENEGLAYPMTYLEDGSRDIAYQFSDERIVMARVEVWELGGLSENTEFGITYWPWGSNVTCDGDYTTLSDNYKVNTVYWGADAVVDLSCEKLGIPGEVMHKIIYDYRDYADDNTFMHDAWEAEQAGDFVLYGKEAGDPRNFFTEQDIELFDWAHSRFQADLSWTLDSAEIIRIWDAAREVLVDRLDARSTLESYYNEGIANLKDAGFTYDEEAEGAAEEIATEEVATEAE